MKINSIFLFFLLILMIQGCTSSFIDNEIRHSDAKLIVLENAISLPIPTYDEIISHSDSIIVKGDKYSLVYNWIYKKEIEFIGSNKSPYNFFKSVFTSPESEQENIFIQAVKGEINHFSSIENNLDFYFYNESDGIQVYILSPSLNFIVSVYYKGLGSKFKDRILNETILN